MQKSFHTTFNRNRQKQTQICEVCKREFKRKEHLTTHLKTHEKPTYDCCKCKSTFKPKSFFDKHVAKCEQSVECYKEIVDGNFICPYCDKIYKHNDHFECHVKKCDPKDCSSVAMSSRPSMVDINNI